MSCGSKALSRCVANRCGFSSKASEIAFKRILTGLGALTNRVTGASLSSAKKVSTKRRSPGCFRAKEPEGCISSGRSSDHSTRLKQPLILDNPGGPPVSLLFDSDLNLVAAAAQRRPDDAMSLRLANLGTLKHPYSVDLYIEKAASQARFVLIRLLGGLDYWRYGIEEFSRAARAQKSHSPSCRATRWKMAGSTPPQRCPPLISALFTPPFSMVGRNTSRRCSIHREPRAQAACMAGTAKLTAIPAAGRFEAGCRKRDHAKGQRSSSSTVP